MKTTFFSEAFDIKKFCGLNPQNYGLFNFNFSSAVMFALALSEAMPSQKIFFILPDAKYLDRLIFETAGILNQTRVIAISDADKYSYLITDSLLALFQNSGAVIAGVTAQMLSQKFPTAETLNNSILNFEKGHEYNFNKILAFLNDNGYEHTDIVRDAGSYSVRGGIIDVFPANYSQPMRLDFFGDTLTSIRGFDAASQRSISEYQSIYLTPLQTTLKKNIYLFEEYFSDNDIVLIYEPVLCQKNSNSDFFENINLQLKKFVRFDLMLLADDSYKNKFTMPLDSNIIYPQNANMSSIIKNIAAGKKRAVLCANYETQIKRLAGILDNNSIKYLITDFNNIPVQLNKTDIHFFIVCSNIIEPFELIDKKIMVITESSLSSGKHIKNKSYLIEKESVPFESFTELNENDYVVHIDYGIGIYKKIETIELEDRVEDCLLIQYADEGKVYLPVDQLHKIQKYIGSGDDSPPVIYSLGGSIWNKVRLKAKKEIWKTAKELVELYARREITTGIKFSQDTPWQLEFEEEFAWEETADQLKAIEEVKKDMESDKTMDRLLCGDVGYGKTEVAARAVFKCLVSNHQAAILCPTTILARQHFNTFKDRLSGYPFKVEMLSRFKTPKEQKTIIKKLKSGAVDIVIGTHRILQNDIEFKNLGLLVIDEEQRFGVKHKEKIKQMKKSVDVLSMTATPIPRTLHLSLLGIRDISIIQTPPRGRIPVEIIMQEDNDEIIKKAVDIELQRGGQIYFIHNRIDDLEKIKERLNELRPLCRIAVLHGRLNADEIEDTMIDFIDKKYDLLLSTTIIENGIDIPNVNTLIISDSDRYGLAQLYQIKGRIGRTDIQAYAYLLHKGQESLSAVSKKRLATIIRYNELGAGFKIAMSDLEIRGAGNIIGAEQHGLIIEIGYELYCKLLTEMIKHLQKNNQLTVDDIDLEKARTIVNIDESSFIPDEYILDSKTKIEIYKRLSVCADYNEMNLIVKELSDRFGRPPAPVNNLISIVDLKIFAAANNISELYITKNRIKLKIEDDETAQKLRLDRDTIFDNKDNRIFYFNRPTNMDIDSVIDFLKTKFKKLQMLPLNENLKFKTLRAATPQPNF